MLNGLSLAILTHTFVFKSTPGAGFGWVSLEPFGCYFGIQCSAKPITIKISDRVGCLCAILVLFARLSRVYIRADRSFPKSQIGTTENNLNCHGNVKLVAVAPIWNHPRFLGTSSKPNHYFQSSVKIHFINGRKFIECQQHSCFR